MKKTFCDRCDQQLIEPDENVSFLGNGSSATGDICWPCRLAEIVDLYNEKAKDMASRPKVGLTFTIASAFGKESPQWIYTTGGHGGQDAQP